MAKKSGVIFHACSPTMKLSGVSKDDLIPQCDDIIGAATFIDLAAKNATILRAEGEALAMIIEANSTAKTIEIITQQMTDEYASYLWLQQWDGRLPAVMTRDEQGLLIDASDFFNP